jgi:hypothetical protein
MSVAIERPEDPVARHYQLMLSGFDVVMAGKTRQLAVPVIQRLPELLPPGDRLVAFVQARMTKPQKSLVTLAATGPSLLAYRDNDADVMLSARWSDISVVEHKQELTSGTRLVLAVSGTSVTFKQLLPTTQADRIFILAGGCDPRPNTLDLLTHGEPSDPGHPPLSSIWNLALYRDRIIDQNGRHLPFAGGEVVATCDTAGNIAVTRGRNLAAKGVGTLFLGPIGLFGIGNAKEHSLDTRELYLLIEGPGWAYTQKFIPDLGQALHQFAQAINAAAREHRGATAPDPPQAADAASRLREMAKLREEGILTDDELAAQKARILAQM